MASLNFRFFVSGENEGPSLRRLSWAESIVNPDHVFSESVVLEPSVPQSHQCIWELSEGHSSSDEHSAQHRTLSLALLVTLLQGLDSTHGKSPSSRC